MFRTVRPRLRRGIVSLPFTYIVILSKVRTRSRAIVLPCCCVVVSSYHRSHLPGSGDVVVRSCIAVLAASSPRGRGDCWLTSFPSSVV